MWCASASVVGGSSSTLMRLGTAAVSVLAPGLATPGLATTVQGDLGDLGDLGDFPPVVGVCEAHHRDLIAPAGVPGFPHRDLRVSKKSSSEGGALARVLDPRAPAVTTTPGVWQKVHLDLLETAHLNPQGTTLVLDIDETLLHSKHVTMNDVPPGDGVFVREDPEQPDFWDVGASSNFSTFILRSQLRPGLKQFLEFAFSSFDNVVIYTAGSERYAKAVCAVLLAQVPGRRFSLIMDRRYTVPHLENGYRTEIPIQIKDLERLGLDLSRVVMLDDHWEGVVQVENVLPIKRFDGALWRDEGLIDATEKLRKFVTALLNNRSNSDMRSLIAADDAEVFSRNLQIVKRELHQCRQQLGAVIPKHAHHWERSQMLEKAHQNALAHVARTEELHPGGEIAGESHEEVILKKVAMEMAHDIANRTALRLGRESAARAWPSTVSPHVLARCQYAKEISALLAVQRERVMAKSLGVPHSSYELQLAHSHGHAIQGRAEGAPRLAITEQGASTVGTLPVKQAEHEVACTAQMFAEPATAQLRWEVAHTSHVPVEVV